MVVASPLPKAWVATDGVADPSGLSSALLDQVQRLVDARVERALASAAGGGEAAAVVAGREVSELRRHCEAEIADVRARADLARQDVSTLAQGMRQLELCLAKWRAENSTKAAVDACRESPARGEAPAAEEEKEDLAAGRRKAGGSLRKEMDGLRAELSPIVAAQVAYALDRQAGGSLRQELDALRAGLSPTAGAQAELLQKLQDGQQELARQVEDCRSLVVSGIEGAQCGVQGALRGMQQLSSAVRTLGRQVRGEESLQATFDRDVAAAGAEASLAAGLAAAESSPPCPRNRVLSDLETRLQGLGQRIHELGHDSEPTWPGESRRPSV